MIDHNGETVESVRDWIIHLEEAHLSPNTIVANARHIARLGCYLASNEKTFTKITISDYDHFLQWLPYSLAAGGEVADNIIPFEKTTIPF